MKLPAFSASEWVWMDRRSSMASLDLALEYMRQRLMMLGPWYVLAVVPMMAVMLMTIDVVMTQRKAMLPVVCLGLTLAVVWRWIIQSIIQRKVQMELSGEVLVSVWRRIGPILMGRLVANFAMSWGGLFILPGITGFFAAGFITPAALIPGGSVMLGIKRAMGLTVTGRLMRVSYVLFLGTMLIALGFVAMQIMLVQMILPSLMGISSVSLSLTMQSLAWMIAAAFFVFMLFDFYWTVASVFVFYDQQSRRLGADLRLRLIQLQEVRQ